MVKQLFAMDVQWQCDFETMIFFMQIRIYQKVDLTLSTFLFDVDRISELFDSINNLFPKHVVLNGGIVTLPYWNHLL